MTSCLTSQPIDVAAVAALVTGPGRGAVVTFTGLVRNHHDGRSVVSLAYSAYTGMAEQAFREIVSEARGRWGVDVAVAHRIGELRVGDVAVAVAVSSDHRAVAFDACRWIIDELKQRVPIWKRERYGDGTEAWVDPTAARDGTPAAR